MCQPAKVQVAWHLRRSRGCPGSNAPCRAHDARTADGQLRKQPELQTSGHLLAQHLQLPPCFLQKLPRNWNAMRQHRRRIEAEVGHPQELGPNSPPSGAVGLARLTTGLGLDQVVQKRYLRMLSTQRGIHVSPEVLQPLGLEDDGDEGLRVGALHKGQGEERHQSLVAADLVQALAAEKGPERLQVNLQLRGVRLAAFLQRLPRAECRKVRLQPKLQCSAGAAAPKILGQAPGPGCCKLHTEASIEVCEHVLDAQQQR
mmetsp:Transcript_85867/g.277263  ORF Transcript_85867/g.277263 Transcript_85867/m.277263 type:complete len:258 (-) Transcript_85867:262-1035(-)